MDGLPNAMKAYWPTTVGTDATGGRTSRGGDRKDEILSVNAMLKAYWRTPQSSEAEHGGPNQHDSGGALCLPAQMRSYWATPTRMDPPRKQIRPSRAATGRGPGYIEEQMLAYGLGSVASSRPGASSTAPCPIAFRAWMMNYPRQYVENWLPPSETRSSGPSRRKSSVQSSKRKE
jgi:hypothetical protein